MIGVLSCTYNGLWSIRAAHMEGKKTGNPILSETTGEVIDHINPGDHICRASSSTRYREWIEQQHEDKSKWVITDFLKVSGQEQRLWNKDLTLNEKAFLFSVQPYLSFDNDLCNDKGVQLGTEELIYLTGISRRTAFTVIKSLTSKFILYQGKNGRGRQYIINPWIMCKGVYVKGNYKALFRDYRIRTLGGKQWGDLKEFQR